MIVDVFRELLRLSEEEAKEQVHKMCKEERARLAELMGLGRWSSQLEILENISGIRKVLGR
jgi:hypothetical protein